MVEIRRSFSFSSYTLDGFNYRPLSSVIVYFDADDDDIDEDNDDVDDDDNDEDNDDANEGVRQM